MAIFLDYIMNSDREIIIIAIAEESGVQHIYQEGELEDAIDLLASPGHIVTWARPPFYVERTFDIDRYPILEDRPMKPRWFDIFSIIRADTGFEASLEKTAKATLGYGPQSKVVKLPSDLKQETSSHLTDALFNRLSILQDLYSYIQSNESVSFYHKSNEITVEVSGLEPSLLSD